MNSLSIRFSFRFSMEMKLFAKIKLKQQFFLVLCRWVFAKYDGHRHYQLLMARAHPYITEYVVQRQLMQWQWRIIVQKFAKFNDDLCAFRRKMCHLKFGENFIKLKMPKFAQQFKFVYQSKRRVWSAEPQKISLEEFRFRN